MNTNTPEFCIGANQIVRTRKELRAELACMGIDGAAAEAILDETAYVRAADRCARTQAAALAAAAEVNETETEEVLRLTAWGLLALDAAGVGGRDGVEGAATARLEPFKGLGTGRKQARDGGAYRSAAVAAMGCLVEGTVSLFPSEVRGSLHWADTRGCAVLWEVPAYAYGQALTLAREGLRLALGMGSWLGEIPGLEFAASVPASDWATLVNGLTQRIAAEAATADPEAK